MRDRLVMLDFWLMISLGFLGSFGHCAGMCGPIAIAFTLSEPTAENQAPTGFRALRFHLLLNLGRLVSYVAVGAAIGGVSSVVIASGQLAGLGSPLRQGMTIAIGLLLIWMGLIHLLPNHLPRLPLLHPALAGNWHDRLNRRMVALSFQSAWWTPALLGLIWGLIPCGFLYAAQMKAAETGTLGQGSLTMLGFGLGTLPTMLAVGMGGALLTASHRQHLFRLGGWVTLVIGLLTLFRSGAMEDYSGYGALIGLALALVARPLHRLVPGLLPCRRIFGVSGGILAIAHVAHLITMGWDLQALPFLLPWMQAGTWAGIVALSLLLPLLVTSWDGMQRWLGDRWRVLHLLSIPAFLLAVVHTILLGSDFLGALEWTWVNGVASAVLAAIAIGVLLIRQPWIWSLCSLEKFYAPAIKR